MTASDLIIGSGAGTRVSGGYFDYDHASVGWCDHDTSPKGFQYETPMRIGHGSSLGIGGLGFFFFGTCRLFVLRLYSDTDHFVPAVAPEAVLSCTLACHK